MLTNFDLENMAKNKYHIPLVSICMKDQLPNKVQNGNYIINLQSSDEGHGTHWTAMVIQGKNAIFMDPFGVYPSLEIRDFVKKRKGCHLGFTTQDIQDVKSSNCGLFCMGFLVYVNGKQNIYQATQEYLQFFSKDLLANDTIIHSFLLSNTKCGCGRRSRRLNSTSSSCQCA